MAKHYVDTTAPAINVIDYAYTGTDWAKVSVVISITAAGAVSAKVTVTHSSGSGAYAGKGL